MMNYKSLDIFLSLYQENKKLFLILGLFFFYYLFLSFTGYGNDDDTYRMMNSGINLISNHLYEPSRFQGYLIPEIVIGFLSSTGGFYLSNAASVLMGVSVLVLYYLTVRKFLSVNQSLMSLFIIGFNPYFVIISSSSMDYIYNLFFLSFGILFLNKRYYVLAAFALAFALSSRLSSGLLVFLIYLYFIIKEVKFKNVFSFNLLINHATYSSILSLLITILLYVPVFVASNYSLSFLTHFDPEFSFSGYVARVAYYNMAVLGGFLAILAIVFTAPYKALYQYVREGKSTLLFTFVIVAIITVEMTFIHLPYEREFLLPLVLLVVPLYLYFSRSLIPAYFILSLTILSNIVNIDIVDIKYITLKNGDIEAQDASIKLGVKPGFVLNDIKTREGSARRYRDLVSINKPVVEDKSKAEYLSKSVF